jgi:hypothetical protein
MNHMISYNSCSLNSIIEITPFRLIGFEPK